MGDKATGPEGPYGVRVEIADVLAATRARPWADQDWARTRIATLEDDLRSVCRRWRLSIDGIHTTGATFPVLDVRTSTGTAAVVKIGHDDAFLHRCRVLVAANGVGYVRLLNFDPERGIALLERLGRTVADARPDATAQISILGDLVVAGWRLPLALAPNEDPTDKARSLSELIEVELSHETSHGRVLDRALDVARELSRQASDVVLVHGDPHSLNALERGDGFALIDPDGFACERAYDLGVIMRDQAREIESLDHTDGAGAGRRWHEERARGLSARHGVDPDRVLAWAFVERVTTGLWLRRLGYADEGERWLTTAARLL